MMIEFLVLAAAVAAGFSATLFLFLHSKREAARRAGRDRKAAEGSTAALTARIEALERRSQELWQIVQTHVPPAPPPSGIDMTKRAQAIQMHRRGEASQTIAAALCLPRNEVELLLKVHGMMTGTG